MKRRTFIAGLGSAAAWPVVARAQQPTMPVIGYLSGDSPTTDASRASAFRQGLTEAGFIDGKNVVIEYRWADGQYDRLPLLAADLVHRQVEVIATIGTPMALAAKSVTSAIPIVFDTGFDPVQAGFVRSLSRPEGNMTGVANLQLDLVAKRLELLHELAPNAAVVGLLVNPNNRLSETETRAAEDGAHSLGLQLHVMRVSTASDIEEAFRTLAELRAGGFVVSADLLFSLQREQIVALAAQQTLPGIYPWRESVAAGGLVSYGANLLDTYRLVGVYTGKILHGAKPANLPVEQAVKVEVIVNLKTAKALGVTVPPTLLARADEVIE